MCFCEIFELSIYELMCLGVGSWLTFQEKVLCIDAVICRLRLLSILPYTNQEFALILLLIILLLNLLS